MKKPDKIKLALSLALTVGTGAIAGICTATQINSWYIGLQKPFFNPPNAVFAPVWTFLYLLMGYSFYLVWKDPADDAAKSSAIAIFFVQLAVNLSWSFVFFTAHAIGWALVDIAVLWVLVNITIGFFNRQSKLAAWLLIPYMLWVSFAGVLNYALWMLNK
ncbi:TspO/MBR family protein [Parasediminibacterium sp. JCM 36343]|uniref:TspO/MBR family protein n=1 Tax=Parasediminibacterium sp. JCM 36343 TaxID=3374279 RepID=UPI00397C7899